MAVDIQRARDDIVYFAKNILGFKLNKYQGDILRNPKKLVIAPHQRFRPKKYMGD